MVLTKSLSSSWFPNWFPKLSKEQPKKQNLALSACPAPHAHKVVYCQLIVYTNTCRVCVCVCLDVPGIVKSLFGTDFDIQLAWQKFKWHSKRLPKVAAGPAGTNLRHSVTQLHYTIYYTIYRVVVVVVVAVVVP